MCCAVVVVVVMVVEVVVVVAGRRDTRRASSGVTWVKRALDDEPAGESGRVVFGSLIACRPATEMRFSPRSARSAGRSSPGSVVIGGEAVRWGW